MPAALERTAQGALKGPTHGAYFVHVIRTIRRIFTAGRCPDDSEETNGRCYAVSAA